jgi:hypothetical protein
MRLSATRTTIALVLTASIAPSAGAMDYPLSSSAIREACFLGTGDPNKRAEFAENYVKRYGARKTGDYVSLIAFETPYMVIAQEIARKGDDYHAPDAVQEYLGKPQVCRIRVEIHWTLNSSAAATTHPNRDVTNYKLRVTQDGREIPVKTRWSDSLVEGGSAPVDVGIALYREFDTENVRSGPVTVEVSGVDGHVLTETFDLDTVR